MSKLRHHGEDSEEIDLKEKKGEIDRRRWEILPTSCHRSVQMNAPCPCRRLALNCPSSFDPFARPSGHSFSIFLSVDLSAREMFSIFESSVELCRREKERLASCNEDSLRGGQTRRENCVCTRGGGPNDRRRCSVSNSSVLNKCLGTTNQTQYGHKQ